MFCILGCVLLVSTLYDVLILSRRGELPDTSLLTDDLGTHEPAEDSPLLANEYEPIIAITQPKNGECILIIVSRRERDRFASFQNLLMALI